MLNELYIKPIITQAEAFSRKVFDINASFCRGLLVAIFTICLTHLAYKAIVNGEFDFSIFVRRIVIFVLIGAFLSTPSGIFWDFVYKPINESSNELVASVLSTAPKSISKNTKDVSAMVDALENGFLELCEMLFEFTKKTGWMAIFVILYAIIIVVIFGASGAIFTLYILGNVLNLTAITAVAPFLILSFGFDGSRAHTFSTIKYVITSVLTLVIASFSLGLMLFVVKAATTKISVEQVSSDTVLMAISAMYILSLLSIYFQMLAPHIAGGIMGTQSSSMLAGVLGGAIAGGVGHISLNLGRSAFDATKFLGKNVANWAFGTALPATFNAMRNPSQTASNVAQSVKSMFSANYNPSKT